MANRLARETSPYLLQHRDNPVDWYPWGEEALARAGELDRPILLSVGYSACHWCHVMERESFEDEATAAYMNEHFVNVKVDREERPDVDALYMEAVQAISGQGGWPMTVFCDPEGVPFYGGTYFPPEEGRGMPSFKMVMEAVLDAFEGRRDELRERAPETRRRLGAIGAVEPDGETPGEELLAAAVSALLEAADVERGGFGGAPKFPPASALELLLARGETAPVERTLDAMMAGGIYDQIGGGFCRYAVDAIGSCPTSRRCSTTTRCWRGPTCTAGRRSATSATAGSSRRRSNGRCARCAAPRAASTRPSTPIRRARRAASTPGPRRRSVRRSARGPTRRWPSTASPRRATSRAATSSTWSAARRRRNRRSSPKSAGCCSNTRERRVRPGLDDKRLCAWNALMIAALAECGAALGNDEYLDAARKCAEFILRDLRDGEGRLLRTYKDGEGRLNAYLEDHAFLLEALLTLHEASFEARWFDAARELADSMIARFGDRERGGFFSTSDDHEQLIARRKEIGDHPIPSGNSAAALGLLRLEALSGERSYGEWAEGVLRLFANTAPRQPNAFAHLLRALDFQLAATKEVALVGDELGELAKVVRGAHRPHLVLAGGPAGSPSPPLLADRPAIEDSPTAYVCENFACRTPVRTAKHLADLL